MLSPSSSFFTIPALLHVETILASSQIAWKDTNLCFTVGGNYSYRKNNRTSENTNHILRGYLRKGL